MSTSSVGSGSVIDVQAVVNQLMQIEQRPLNLAKQRVSSATVSISAMSDLKAKLDALASSLKDMEDSRMLAGRSVSSSDATLVKASVTSDTLATAGSYTVKNTSLASAKIIQLPGFSDRATTPHNGTLTFSDPPAGGSLGIGSFTLTITGKTLDEVRDLINADSRLAGKVTASVVNDGVSTNPNPYSLVLSGSKTGVDADFSVVPTGFSSTPSVLLAPANALATVNGLQVQSKTNTFTEAIGGLSFDVLKADLSPAGTTITVTNNKSTLKERVKSFAANLSSLYTQIDALTKPGSANEKAGPLAGNSAILSLRLALSTAYSAGFVTTGTSRVYRWSDLGLEVQRNGSVTVREADLGLAIDGVTTIYGGARRIGDEMLGGFTSSAVASPSSFSGIRAAVAQFAGTSGTIQRTIDTLNTTKRSRESEIEGIQSRLDATRKSLIAKYAALDTKLARGNQMLANVQSSLGSLRA